MAFDQTKDVLVREIGRQKKLAEEGKVFLAARVYQYDGGEPKLAIERIRLNKEGGELGRSMFGTGSTTRGRLRLGRVSMQEALWIGKAIARWWKSSSEPEPDIKSKPGKKKSARKRVKKVATKKPSQSEPHKVSEPRAPGVKPAKGRRRKKRPVKKVKS